MRKKYIYVNLKRFEIPNEEGGVNSLAPVEQWANYIVRKTSLGVQSFKETDYEFTFFFPEAHIIGASSADNVNGKIHIGCQSVYRDDVEKGKNFGAFTSNRTAKSMKVIGVDSTIIGHCEERNDKMGILDMAGIDGGRVVNEILNQEILAAQLAGLKVLYCIGEKATEQDRWQEVLKQQIELGLKGVDTTNVVIAYEPVWAIGPGKTPPGKEYIEKISRYIKEITKGLPVVYGGGLKADNSKMLASIESIDGGLIALTRFSGDIGFYPDEFIEIVSLYTNID